MSENYDKIIDKVDKYYYFILTKKGPVFIASSNSVSDAKQKTIKKLEPHISKFIGKKLIFIKIKNTYDKFKESKKSSDKIKTVGGPICFEVLSGTIDNKKKINNEQIIGNNKYYLSKEYIRNNINKINKDIKKIIKMYNNDLTNQIFLKINIL